MTILRPITSWVLQCVSEKKHLGVIVIDDFKWEKQCSEAVKKANRILGMIKRYFTDRSQSTLIPLYKSLDRPHLEYCCSVWNPHFRKYIELVKGVQNVGNWTFCSQDHSLPGAKVPGVELSLLVLSKRIQDGAKVRSRELNILDCQSILTRRLIFVVVITSRYHITVD